MNEEPNYGLFLSRACELGMNMFLPNVCGTKMKSLFVAWIWGCSSVVSMSEPYGLKLINASDEAHICSVVNASTIESDYFVIFLNHILLVLVQVPCQTN